MIPLVGLSYPLCSIRESFAPIPMSSQIRRDMNHDLCSDLKTNQHDTTTMHDISLHPLARSPTRSGIKIDRKIESQSCLPSRTLDTRTFELSHSPQPPSLSLRWYCPRPRHQIHRLLFYANSPYHLQHVFTEYVTEAYTKVALSLLRKVDRQLGHCTRSGPSSGIPGISAAISWRNGQRCDDVHDLEWLSQHARKRSSHTDRCANMSGSILHASVD